MLNRLSGKYQKEIALSFLSMFFISGLTSLKAQSIYYNRYSGVPYSSHQKSNDSDFISPTREVVVRKSYPITDSYTSNSLELSKLESQTKTASVNVKNTQKPKSFSINDNKYSPNIGGPGQPEMSSYKSVGADNMVSPFTGDFSYNIPLLDVGGYPINMFYNSGITMDQEASWVGLGWNINPGTVSRNMRGLPDDFDGTDIITKRQSTRPDKTWGVTLGADGKIAGFPFGGLNLGVSLGVSFNNKLGVAAEAGLNPALSLSADAKDAKSSGSSASSSAAASVPDTASSASVGVTLSAPISLSSRNGAKITPSIGFDLTKSQGDRGTTASLGAGYTYSSRQGLEGMHLNAGLKMSLKDAYQKMNGMGSGTVSQDVSTLNSSISFVYPTVVPSINNIYTRTGFNLNLGLGGELFGLNAHGKIMGYFNKTEIAPEDQETKHPAYGMLHYQDATGNSKALLDFNRINDGVYTPSSPAIALPMYTYDIFSITGEGTGGSFRAYRGDMGYMRDATVSSKSGSSNLDLDLGFGNTIHGGGEFSDAFSQTIASSWEANNLAAKVLKFKSDKGKFQAAYFKNPGEKAIPDIDYQNAIGGEDLVRYKLGNIGSGTPMLMPNLIKYDANKNNLGVLNLNEANTSRNNRDKRTQVISYLTSEEASRIGFNKKIYSYNTDNKNDSSVIFSSTCNKNGIDSFYRKNTENGIDPNVNSTGTDSYRKANHISEIDVLGTDGRKYVYGLPVYNIRKVDVSFAIENGSMSSGKSTYVPGTDNTALNAKGRDWYMQQEETPAYTHSYLLTELVSPNYVDVTGDGISEDDMGDAVKFNYTKYTKGIKWRTPIDNSKASYNEGLKTDPKDDKAHYIYGEREMWLTYSIESKNMVARFFVKNDRKDGRQSAGESGGIDATWGMQRLDKINLYSKGDLVKYNGKAKPIKTIRFFHSYKLTPNVDDNNGDGVDINGNVVPISSSANINFKKGKLTLDSIWITYNGNTKKAKSRYVFSYPAANNPDYKFNYTDRWDNYKDPITNPGSLLNADFPYTIQNKTQVDNNVAAWTMNKILLPSGGEINVDYESDEYAYVQEKKAASMYQVLGFGLDKYYSPQNTTVNQLYYYSPSPDKKYIDKDFVYVQLPYAITGNSEVDKQRELTARYFENTSQLFMKLMVPMPSGNGIPGSSGSEIIPVYADILEYGLVSANVAWVKVKRVAGGTTPMAQQALQFLKQQLPGKAYTGYDMSENGTVKAVAVALVSMMTSIGELFRDEAQKFRGEGKCKIVELDKSFARLSNPYYKKLGGGLRVKKVTINDNWNKMTGQYEASYGQEYRYTKTELINNKPCVISSGVAAWEPAIGGDENPHKSIMRFMNHNKGGPYDFGAIDLPLGEAFYPAPTVGYSRVEVVSIHRDTVKNLPTRQVTEFYTTRDFPFKSTSTQLTDPDANVKYEPSAIKELLHLDMNKAVTLSQGFLVDMNDMNGKEKIQATYSAFDSINPISRTENFYNIEKATDNTYKFNHIFPTLATTEGKITSNIIGRDIEVMSDFRQNTSETVTTNIHVNFDFFFFGVFPVPLALNLHPTITENTTFRSAAILKIVNHFGMLDSVVSMDKGSMVSTKNLIYDAETGNPLITRTQNEHNQPIYNYSTPAHWAYGGMGAAYKNIDASYKDLQFSHGKLTTNTVETGELFSLLESGDELYALSKTNDNDLIPFIDPCDANSGSDPWSTRIKNKANRIWAINTSKVASITPQWLFMDKDGNPYNANHTDIRIVRSGHRNMLDQNVGSITSMEYPVNSLTNTLEFNDAKNIIQTNAATFKDHWRVDNSFYLVDSVVKTDNPLPVHKKTISSASTLNILKWHEPCSFCGNGYNYTATTNPVYFMAEQQSSKHGSNHSKHYLSSWASFNFSTIPQDAIIVTAKLNLISHSDPAVPPHFQQGHAVPSHGSTNGLEGLASHRNDQPHIRNPQNNFKLTRIFQNWNGDAANYSGENAYSDNIGAVGVGNVGNNQSYIFGNQCSADNRIDITKMATNMLRERSIPAVVRLELINHNNYDNPFNQTDPVRVCFLPPSVDIYYYTCAEPNAAPGDATVCIPTGNTNTASRSSESPETNLSSPVCSSCFPQFYCTTYQHRLFCLSKSTQKKSINPYTEGILGNWRVDSTYAYYGNRKETDPTLPVDTRKGGSIVNYKKFWNFALSSNDNITRNYAANDVWVWNSTITQYNRKGYEIENKDPLGRFNSGLYGYNQQLPIAVANNARVREVLYDGFEDYDYSTAQGCLTCKPRRYFNYDVDITSKLDYSQAHSGRASIKLNAGQTVSIKAPVTNTTEADKGYALRVKVDSTYTLTGIVGLGLKTEYYNTMNNSGAPIWTSPNTNPNFTSSFLQSIPGLNLNNISIKWTGKLKIPVTGNYSFKASAFHEARITIANGNNTQLVLESDFGAPGMQTSPNVTLQGGQLYDITIQYQKLSGNGSNIIEWNVNPNTLVPGSAYFPLNSNFLYSPTNVYTTTNITCARLDSVNVRGNALTDTFSLLQDKKMVISGWVKEGGNDCKCNSYINNNITISFTGGSQSIPSMKASGSIIEGWQRYEGVFDVPTNATAITVALNNTTSNGSPVYFDDIRIHPFNANVKSFVYNSSNLRLMSELDENNYASFYEYDDDGTLTRVKKETQRGIKTITETRSALQQIITP